MHIGDNAGSIDKSITIAINPLWWRAICFFADYARVKLTKAVLRLPPNNQECAPF